MRRIEAGTELLSYDLLRRVGQMDKDKNGVKFWWGANVGFGERGYWVNLTHFKAASDSRDRGFRKPESDVLSVVRLEVGNLSEVKSCWEFVETQRGIVLRLREVQAEALPFGTQEFKDIANTQEFCADFHKKRKSSAPVYYGDLDPKTFRKKVNGNFNTVQAAAERLAAVAESMKTNAYNWAYFINS